MLVLLHFRFVECRLLKDRRYEGPKRDAGSKARWARLCAYHGVVGSEPMVVPEWKVWK